MKVMGGHCKALCRGLIWSDLHFEGSLSSWGRRYWSGTRVGLWRLVKKMSGGGGRWLRGVGVEGGPERNVGGGGKHC